jgi:hypothetical protein
MVPVHYWEDVHGISKRVQLDSEKLIHKYLTLFLSEC